MNLTDEQIRQKFFEIYPTDAIKQKLFDNAKVKNGLAFPTIVESRLEAFTEGFKAALSLQGEAVKKVDDVADNLAGYLSIILDDKNTDKNLKKCIKEWFDKGRSYITQANEQCEAMPVAWRWFYHVNKTYVIFQQFPSGLHERHPDEIEPLYTSPPLTTAQQSELIRKCAEMVEVQIGNARYIYQAEELRELKARILALLPEEGKG